MATFNWSYKPGITNKYGISIANSTDDVRPSNACYISISGNDITNNGSRLYPYRTIAKACQSVPNGTFMIISSGIYREGDISDSGASRINTKTFVGDGNVIIDFSYYQGFHITEGTGVFDAYNIKFKGNTTNFFCTNGAGTRLGLQDVIVDGCSIGENGDIRTDYLSGVYSQKVKNTVFLNVNRNINILQMFMENCTFYNCNNINIQNSNHNIRACIFMLSNINFTVGTIHPSYTLFYQCNFKFNTQKQETSTPVYPNATGGYQYISDIDTLRAAYTAAYPTITNPLVKSLMGDPKFNNKDIGDFTLAFDSPAKNASYLGTYIGSRSIGYALTSKSNSTLSGFDRDTIVNLTEADNSITLIDTALEGSLESKVIPNTIGRELKNLPTFGMNADRNGQYIDSIGDLANTTISPGTNLNPNTPYLVETAAITYNALIYQPGERFTTTSVLSFTSGSNGVVREIVEAPQRHTVLARFFNGGSLLDNSANLVIGWWYFVETGSVIYNGSAYNTNSVFKCVNAATTFTGSGNVREAMTTQSYQHYEINSKPYSNNIGDVRSGEIVRGNGDPLFERGDVNTKIFPISQKFIQVKYILKVNNLKP